MEVIPLRRFLVRRMIGASSDLPSASVSLHGNSGLWSAARRHDERGWRVSWARRLLTWADALLVRERVRNYALILIGMGWLALLVNTALGPFPVTLSGVVVAPDFLANWTSGRLILLGRVDELYDPAAQTALQVATVPSTSDLSWFISPPTTALLFVPLAALPYGWAALVWAAVTVAALGLALSWARPLLRSRQGDHRLFVLVMWSTPPVFELIGSGQSTALALLVVMLSLRLAGRGKEIGAGAVLAAGLYKPHLFVLVPVVLLVQRRYRALGALTATSVLVVLATLPAVGPGAWTSWARALASPLYSDQIKVGLGWKMQSVSALNTALGVPANTAYVYLLIGIAAFVWVARRFREDTSRVWALALMTTVVFSPHAMVYDLVLLAPVAAFFLGRRNTRAARVLGVLTCVVLWSTPLRYAVATLDPRWQLLSAPWSAVPLLGLWLLLVVSHGKPVAARPATAGDASAGGAPADGRTGRDEAVR
jgi:hypothetical protein